MDMKQIGKNVATLRKNNGYTQESLAEKLSISPQAVSKWETGIGLPEATLLVELSDLFRVSVDEIIKPGKKQTITDFINRNLAAPTSKTLSYIPRISRWTPPEGCDMHYSMPAMIAEALCCIEAYDAGQAEHVAMAALNDRFRDLMHIMGIGYGFLWRQQHNLIEELWHINDFREMADRAMRYYGRDYLWLTNSNATPDEMRKIIIWSIDKGHPVVMEWSGGIPEFSIVTGYEDNGNTLIGWTYCEECAAKTNDAGMFVNPARWNENFDFHVLVIGDKVAQSLSDKDTIDYALEVLDRKTPGDVKITETVAGDPALQKWLEACDTTENTVRLFTISDIYTHALYQNSIYTQKCLLPYFKKLAVRHNHYVNDIVIQIGIAIGIIERDRKGLDTLKGNPEAYANACKQHIDKLIKHREYMRGWLKELAALL